MVREVYNHQLLRHAAKFKNKSQNLNFFNSSKNAIIFFHNVTRFLTFFLQELQRKTNLIINIIWNFSVRFIFFDNI